MPVYHKSVLSSHSARSCECECNVYLYAIFIRDKIQINEIFNKFFGCWDASRQRFLKRFTYKSCITTQNKSRMRVETLGLSSATEYLMEFFVLIRSYPHFITSTGESAAKESWPLNYPAGRHISPDANLRWRVVVKFSGRSQKWKCFSYRNSNTPNKP